MRKVLSFLKAGAVVGASCLAAAGAAMPVPPNDPTEVFIKAVETAHGAGSWREQRAVAADFRLVHGQRPPLAGKLLFKQDMSASRFEIEGGPVLVYDGRDAWVSPASAQFPGARFHLLTWPYFIALPMKLRDPGVNIQPLGDRPLFGKAHPAARLTFDPGTGDTPDDWYIVYRDPDKGLVSAVAYIVTYGKPVEEASREPHALSYEDFVKVGGATLATRWRLWSWDEEKGIQGEPLGEARLSNLRFVTPPAGAFSKPADSRKDEIPKGAS